MTYLNNDLTSPDSGETMKDYREEIKQLNIESNNEKTKDFFGKTNKQKKNKQKLTF